MPVPLILCRLKDDHTVVHEIGETALVYFPDWEPVPTEPEKKVAEQKPPIRTKAAGSAAKEKE